MLKKYLSVLLIVFLLASCTSVYKFDKVETDDREFTVHKLVKEGKIDEAYKLMCDIEEKNNNIGYTWGKAYFEMYYRRFDEAWKLFVEVAKKEQDNDKYPSLYFSAIGGMLEASYRGGNPKNSEELYQKMKNNQYSYTTALPVLKYAIRTGKYDDAKKYLKKYYSEENTFSFYAKSYLALFRKDYSVFCIAIKNYIQQHEKKGFTISHLTFIDEIAEIFEQGKPNAMFYLAASWFNLNLKKAKLSKSYFNKAKVLLKNQTPKQLMQKHNINPKFINQLLQANQ